MEETLPKIAARSVYVARYGKDAWVRAVALASQHRRRAAADQGLANHWAASEWLDLCASLGFQCPLCGNAGPLTPHHRRELSRRGENTIHNILPLCRACHLFVHKYQIDCDPHWLADQQSLCSALHPGGLVQDKGFWRKEWPPLGSTQSVVIEVVKPHRQRCLPDPATGGREARGGGLVLVAGQLDFWTQGKVRLVTAYSDKFFLSPHLVDACGLRNVSEADQSAALDTIQAQEAALYRRFRVGDRVAWEFGMFRGIIMQITPPDRKQLSSIVGGVTVSITALVPSIAEAEIALLTETDQLGPKVTTAVLRELKRMRID